MDLSAIRTGLANQLDNVAGLRASGVALDNPNPPIAIVWPAKGEFLTYDTMTSQPDKVELTVTILVAKASDRTGQAALDGFLNGLSVWAILTDPTLGGLVASTQFTGAGNYGLLDWAGVQYYGVEVAVECLSR